MQTIEIINRLRSEKFSILLISKQTGVSYMRLYRYANGLGELSELEHAAVRSFAFVQPCFQKDVKK